MPRSWARILALLCCLIGLSAATANAGPTVTSISAAGTVTLNGTVSSGASAAWTVLVGHNKKSVHGLFRSEGGNR